jgi:hypothetical protein
VAWPRKLCRQVAQDVGRWSESVQGPRRADGHALGGHRAGLSCPPKQAGRDEQFGSRFPSLTSSRAAHRATLDHPQARSASCGPQGAGSLTSLFPSQPPRPRSGPRSGNTDLILRRSRSDRLEGGSNMHWSRPRPSRRRLRLLLRMRAERKRMRSTCIRPVMTWSELELRRRSGHPDRPKSPALALAFISTKGRWISARDADRMV